MEMILMVVKKIGPAHRPSGRLGDRNAHQECTPRPPKAPFLGGPHLRTRESRARCQSLDSWAELL
jgi:hypothetical protein